MKYVNGFKAQHIAPRVVSGEVQPCLLTIEGRLSEKESIFVKANLVLSVTGYHGQLEALVGITDGDEYKTRFVSGKELLSDPCYRRIAMLYYRKVGEIYRRHFKKLLGLVN